MNAPISAGYRAQVLAPDGTVVGEFTLDRGGCDVTTASGRAFLGHDVLTAVELHHRRAASAAKRAAAPPA